MSQNVDSLICDLTPTIEQKCKELKAARKEKILSIIFILLCVTVVLIPTLLVFVGVSLTVLIVPIVFMSLSVILLLPVLLSGKAAEQGGFIYEQA